jgi:hypothetical protein
MNGILALRLLTGSYIVFKQNAWHFVTEQRIFGIYGNQLNELMKSLIAY